MIRGQSRAVLDAEPLIYKEQLELWEWIAQYYMCSEGEVMAASLPAHFKLSSESILVFNESFGDDFSSLDHDEYLVAEALLLKKELKIPDVQEILHGAAVYPVVKRLIDKSVCYVYESLKELYKPKTETYISLHPDYTSEEKLEALLNQDKKWSRAEKQMELLLSFLHHSKNRARGFSFRIVEKIRCFRCTTESSDYKKYPGCRTTVGRPPSCFTTKYSYSL